MVHKTVSSHKFYQKIALTINNFPCFYAHYDAGIGARACLATHRFAADYTKCMNIWQGTAG